jgi:hypothetical protein
VRNHDGRIADGQVEWTPARPRPVTGRPRSPGSLVTNRVGPGQPGEEAGDRPGGRDWSDRGMATDPYKTPTSPQARRSPSPRGLTGEVAVSQVIGQRRAWVPTGEFLRGVVC